MLTKHSQSSKKTMLINRRSKNIMDLTKVKKVREETDFKKVNVLLSVDWKILEILPTGKGFKYILVLA